MKENPKENRAVNIIDDERNNSRNSTNSDAIYLLKKPQAAEDGRRLSRYNRMTDDQ